MHIKYAIIQRLGRLSYLDPKSWSVRVKMGLKVSFESYLLQQQQAAEAALAGSSHAHFRWFMFLGDFLAHFSFEFRLLYLAIDLKQGSHRVPQTSPLLVPQLI